MTVVVWTFAAIADVEGIRRYVETFNPRAAQSLAEALIEAAESLADFPHRGRPVVGTQLRELTFVRPYIIRYRVEPERVIVMRVRHGRRWLPNP